MWVAKKPHLVSKLAILSVIHIEGAALNQTWQQWQQQQKKVDSVCEPKETLISTKRISLKERKLDWSLRSSFLPN